MPDVAFWKRSYLRLLTGRRSAADLIKSLVSKFPAEVTSLFTTYVQSMLEEYAAAPSKNWKAKDCAIHLVVALTVQGKTTAQVGGRANCTGRICIKLSINARCAVAWRLERQGTVPANR